MSHAFLEMDLIDALPSVKDPYQRWLFECALDQIMHMRDKAVLAEYIISKADPGMAGSVGDYYDARDHIERPE